ncbi:TPA: NACHT domain-containing NTPase [Citrobacter sedlakii]|nr:NACHT domain-containing protein [Citrobacter sedlakii]
MKPEYLRKIESLQREVDDFHPVLRVLLPRLPTVTHVEYKQGPSEKGADFVIIKRDEALDEETYIGVICKVGKITQSNNEVERQIEECQLFPRLISSGSKNIHLNEIWVVTNSSISNNAQEKIHLKFKSTNIKFVDGEKVCSLISKYYPEFWDFESINYEQYLTDTLQTISDAPESSFFGSVGINNLIDRYISKEDHKKRRHNPLKLYSVVRSERFIFLEGTVGSGKSTLLKQLIEKIKEEYSYEKDCILPIFCQYKDLLEKKLDIENIKQGVLSKYKIQHDGNVLLIIDSVDEVKESLEERLDNFKGIVERVSRVDKLRVLVASRVMDSLQDYEVIDKMFTRYSIIPLSTGQIIDFVDKICDDIKITNKLKNGIEKTPLFKFIPRTPVSAILLARILSDEIKELPSTMTELYSKYSEIVLGRWDTSKGLLSQTEYDVISNILIEIAMFMMDNSLNCISISEVQDMFLTYLSRRNLNVDEEKLFNRLIYRSEVTTLNVRTNTFSFLHRSFMEYFYAEGLRKRGSVDINDNIYDIYWANSYFFYFGLIRDNENLIDKINELKPSNDKTRFLKLFYNGSFYLASYLTPYNKITKGVLSSYIDAGKLYVDILKGNTDIPLKEFSPVALLCIFTKCLTNNYSYEFFKSALEDLSVQIEQHEEIGEHIDYARFFIASTLNELGDKSAFDGLVENNKLGILINLGITHVTDDSGLLSTTVDKYLKKFNKKVRSNHDMSNYISKLYDESTGALRTNLQIQ